MQFPSLINLPWIKDKNACQNAARWTGQVKWLKGHELWKMSPECPETVTEEVRLRGWKFLWHTVQVTYSFTEVVNTWRCTSLCAQPWRHCLSLKSFKYNRSWYYLILSVYCQHLYFLLLSVYLSYWLTSPKEMILSSTPMLSKLIDLMTFCSLGFFAHSHNAVSYTHLRAHET